MMIIHKCTTKTLQSMLQKYFLGSLPRSNREIWLVFILPLSTLGFPYRINIKFAIILLYMDEDLFFSCSQLSEKWKSTSSLFSFDFFTQMARTKQTCRIANLSPEQRSQLESERKRLYGDHSLPKRKKAKKVKKAKKSKTVEVHRFILFRFCLICTFFANIYHI